MSCTAGYSLLDCRRN